MKIMVAKVLLFLSFVFSHHLNADDWQEYISWQKTASALAGVGVVTCVAYCFYSLVAQYVGKHIVKYGPKVGGVVSSVACTGFIVAALNGKNPFDAQSTHTCPATGSLRAMPLSRRIGCGIGGLALLFLSWRYWQSCRPGIEFYHTGLMLPLASLVSIGAAVITSLKPLHGMPEEKNMPTIKHVSIAVAYAVGAAIAGIVSWQYYWQPILYGA